MKKYKLELFFVNILAKCLGFSIKMEENTIVFTSETKRGEKNLRDVFLKVFEKENK